MKIAPALSNRLKFWLLPVLFLICSAFVLRAEDSYIRGVHYYGFNPCAWPVNYLDTLPLHEVDSDLKTVADDGFNIIILLVPWGKCEIDLETPTPVYNEDAFNKLNTMIRTAARHNLAVVLRIPYTWALDPGQTHANGIRPIEALYDMRVRQKMLRFFSEVQQRLILPNPNVQFAFMSWEDFSGAYHPAPDTAAGLLPGFASYMASHGLSKPAAIPATDSPLRGPYLEWLDEQLLQLHAEAQQSLPGLSLEVRIDADPVVGQDGKRIWQNHAKTFDVPASKFTTVYWSPYYGQRNNGEQIAATAATESLSRMLSMVSEFTSNPLFIDQFNFFDNSAGFEKNAAIEPKGIGDFLANSAALLRKKTSGYALWTYRDYLQNMLYNATFQNGLEGWTVTGGTPSVDADGVLLKAGQELSQIIPAWRIDAFGGNKNAEVFLFIHSAKQARVTLTQNGRPIATLNLKGQRAGPADIHSVNLKAAGPHTFGIRVDSGTLTLAGAAVSGHRQRGEVRGLAGETLAAWKPIVKLNSELAAAVHSGIVLDEDISPLLEGIYPDQWCGKRVEGNLSAPAEATKLDLELWLPEWLEKNDTLSVAIGSQLVQAKLKPGLNTVSIPLPQGAGGGNLRYRFQFSYSIIPGENDASSRDKRELAAVLKSAKFRR